MFGPLFPPFKLRNPWCGSSITNEMIGQSFPNLAGRGGGAFHIGGDESLQTDLQTNHTTPHVTVHHRAARGQGK